RTEDIGACRQHRDGTGASEQLADLAAESAEAVLGRTGGAAQETAADSEAADGTAAEAGAGSSVAEIGTGGAAGVGGEMLLRPPRIPTVLSRGRGSTAAPSPAPHPGFPAGPKRLRKKGTFLLRRNRGHFYRGLTA